MINGIHASLAFLLSAAYRKLFNHGELVIEHSFGDGYFCHKNDWTPIDQKDISKLEELMKDWIENEIPIVSSFMSQKEIIEKFNSFGLSNKPSNIVKWDVDPVPIVQFGKYFDYRIESVETDKSKLKHFELRKYNNGLLLRFPTITSPNELQQFKDRPKLFSIIEEYEHWGEILNVESINHLNKNINENGIKEFVWISEGLHEKKIVEIAQEIASNYSKKRVITIAGPSSSGKTTFAKRLGIQLKVNGFKTTEISMDNYFINRDDVPFDKNGFQDFESFNVLDNELLSNRINLLINGESVPDRKFDFNKGIAFDRDEQISLGENEFIILEGIHCLNPRLTNSIADGKVQKIYVSAITQLNIDGDHRISTSDNRLIRRIVRDHKFRNYTPLETLDRWKSVRLGEEKNIFPYQEEADFIFNSALVYELPVLGSYITNLLKDVKKPNQYENDIERILNLLSFFEVLPESIVPGISILREFIGKSDFNY
jgi:uridine kinase